MNHTYVGVTATQRGMTQKQKDRFRLRLEELQPEVLVHGGCIGGDDEADEIAFELGIYRLIYPSNHPTKALPIEHFRERGGRFIYKCPMPPLVRNKSIVEAITYLIACPAQAEEIIRSGTWTTVRYARRQHGKSRVEVLEQ